MSTSKSKGKSKFTCPRCATGYNTALGCIEHYRNCVGAPRIDEVLDDEVVDALADDLRRVAHEVADLTAENAAVGERNRKLEERLAATLQVCDQLRQESEGARAREMQCEEDMRQFGAALKRTEKRERAMRRLLREVL